MSTTGLDWAGAGADPPSMPPRPLNDLAALRARVAGRYSIERELGRGGMGVVYLARDIALDRRVAIKLLPGGFAAQPMLRERFLREARLAARLSHPNIVPIHAVEEHPDAVFFAMGYIEGETLGQRLARVGALPAAEVGGLLQQVAWALAYAHGRGVIHRDVKPDNILIERGTGHAYVMDFGIARASELAGAGPDAQLTEVGHVVGTAAFMSPEQASGDALDGRSDLYSLGVVGFLALTGRLPFSAPTSQALIAKHLSESPPPVASVLPGVPVRLAAAIDRMLSKDPDTRPATGEAVAEAIGPAARAEVEIAAPLRTFLRVADQNAQVAVVLVPLVVLAVLRPAVALPLFFMGLAVIGARVIELALVARRVYRMGYRFSDLSQAFVLDARAREDEARQLARASDPALVRRAIRRGVAMAAAGALWFAGAVWLAATLRGQTGRGIQLAIILIGILGLVAAMFGIMTAVQVWSGNRRGPERARRRGKFWSTALARRLFDLAVRGVRPAPPREAAGALDDLLAEVEAGVSPPERSLMRNARSRLARLAAEIERLRDRERKIDRSIAEAGIQEVTERLRAARKGVAGQLAAAAARVDAIRVKLIMIRSGVAPAVELAELVAAPAAEAAPAAGLPGSPARSGGPW